jgi:hypothetical protein
MQRRHRITFSIAIALCVISCSGNKKEVESAKHSLYDTDFAIVFSAALESTRLLYGSLDDYPGTGSIKTAWHQVPYASTQDDVSNTQTISNNSQQSPTAGAGVGGGVSQGAGAGSMPTRLAYKRYFIRFDVQVAGGRPWRVKVVGHAAEWDPGNAMPTELHGIARPPWLDGRTEALQVAIYRRIKPYAVPMKELEVAKDEDTLPKTDPTSFKGVPPAAAKTLAALKDALGHRDYPTLRSVLAEDVVWSLGGSPGAETAMAMWQADPETLDAMGRAIASGCASADKRVVCPAGAAVPNAFQLILEQRGDSWKVASFVKSE